MSSNIRIKYINNSMNKDLPKIFVFAKNEIPTFDSLKDGVAWKVISNIGRGSSCEFTYPIHTSVGATWDKGCNRTALLKAGIGERYTVEKNDTGIVLTESGDALAIDSIEVANTIHTQNGICAQLYKDGQLLMEKDIVAYNQKATFVIHPSLYWGIASEIQEGNLINSAVLNSDHFHQLILEGLSDVTISLNGNAKDGYEFRVEHQE